MQTLTTVTEKLYQANALRKGCETLEKMMDTEGLSWFNQQVYANLLMRLRILESEIQSMQKIEPGITTSG